MFSIVKYAMKSMLRKRARAMLTMLGILIGVVSVLVISTIGEMGKALINQELESMGVSGLTVTANVNHASQNLSAKDLQTIAADASVESATPLTVSNGKSSFCGVESDCMVWGIDANVQSIITLELLHGRMLNRGDIAAEDAVCVVDEEYAKANYLRTNIVGKTARLQLGGGYREYRIIGVVSTGGSILKNFISDFVPTFVYLPYSTLEKELGIKGFNRIAVKLSDESDSAVVSETLKASLQNLSLAEREISVENLSAQKDKLNGILNIVTVILAVIAGISLAVSGLSIMTVMLTSVHERTREIGIKKSIGASKKIILFEFLAESFFLSLCGGVFGVVGGCLLIGLGCLLTGMAFQIRLTTVLLCIGFAVTVGVLFGVYPAKKAADLNPAQAIRCE